MIPEYKYQAHDHSLLTPIFKKQVVDRVMRKFPVSIPANLITICSNLFIYFALILAFFYRDYHPLKFLVIAICAFIYLLGDHMDGAQAKRTGTSSPLGEFFDHYLDIFNNGIFIYILYLLFNVSSVYILAVYLLFSYLAHTVLLYEQYQSKWLNFERIGTFEGVVLAILFMLAGSVPAIFNVLIHPYFSGFSLFTCIFLLSLIGALITFFKTLIRAKIKNYKIYLFFILLILVSFTTVKFYHSYIVFAIIVIYSSLFIGDIQRAHLCGGRLELPDILFPVFTFFIIIILIMIDIPFQFFDFFEIYFIILFMYLIICALSLFISTVYQLRQFWYWKNPE